MNVLVILNMVEKRVDHLVKGPFESKKKRRTEARAGVLEQRRGLGCWRRSCLAHTETQPLKSKVAQSGHVG